jgi:hypothetical protein
MNDYLKLLKVLCDAQVRFVIIGGAAAAAQGVTYPTYDLDICYDRGRDNIDRLARALEPFHPRLRGVPDDLPFSLDSVTIAHGMNFTLTTDLGDIDLFGEVLGIGGYREVKALSATLSLFGFECAVLSLDGLIRSKRATARPKDLLVLQEMEALREIEIRVKPQPQHLDTLNQDSYDAEPTDHKQEI